MEKRRLQSYISIFNRQNLEKPKLKLTSRRYYNHVVATQIDFQQMLDQSNLLVHAYRALLTYALTKKLDQNYFFASGCKCFKKYYEGVFRNCLICGVLRDLVPFVQFKKREKHL